MPCWPCSWGWRSLRPARSSCVHRVRRPGVRHRVAARGRRRGHPRLRRARVAGGAGREGSRLRGDRDRGRDGGAPRRAAGSTRSTGVSSSSTRRARPSTAPRWVSDVGCSRPTTTAALARLIKGVSNPRGRRARTPRTRRRARPHQPRAQLPAAAPPTGRARPAGRVHPRGRRRDRPPRPRDGGGVGHGDLAAHRRRHQRRRGHPQPGAPGGGRTATCCTRGPTSEKAPRSTSAPSTPPTAAASPRLVGTLAFLAERYSDPASAARRDRRVHPRQRGRLALDVAQPGRGDRRRGDRAVRDGAAAGVDRAASRAAGAAAVRLGHAQLGATQLPKRAAELRRQGAARRPDRRVPCRRRLRLGRCLPPVPAEPLRAPLLGRPPGDVRLRLADDHLQEHRAAAGVAAAGREPRSPASRGG